MLSSPSFSTSSSVVYTPASLDKGRSEVVVQASTPFSRFCWRSYRRPVVYASWRSFLGVSCSWWLSLSSAHASILLSTFLYAHVHSTTGARFEVGWAARVQPGRRLGRFNVRG
jgi:hypothetical protein